MLPTPEIRTKAGATIRRFANPGMFNAATLELQDAIVAAVDAHVPPHLIEEANAILSDPMAA